VDGIRLASRTVPEMVHFDKLTPKAGVTDGTCLRDSLTFIASLEHIVPIDGGNHDNSGPLEQILINFQIRHVAECKP
jgi:hypothetical protein